MRIFRQQRQFAIIHKELARIICSMFRILIFDLERDALTTVAAHPIAV